MVDVVDRATNSRDHDPFPKNDRITPIITFQHRALVFRSSPSPSLSGTALMETPILSCQRGGKVEFCSCCEARAHAPEEIHGTAAGRGACLHQAPFPFFNCFPQRFAAVHNT
jgi:hypothetical protein